MKITKQRLSEIIEEEAVKVLKEIKWTDEKLLTMFQTLEFNRQKIDAWKDDVNKLINAILSNMKNVRSDISAVKQQIFGLEQTAAKPVAASPVLPSSDATKTIKRKKRVAENKIQ